MALTAKGTFPLIIFFEPHYNMIPTSNTPTIYSIENYNFLLFLALSGLFEIEMRMQFCVVF